MEPYERQQFDFFLMTAVNRFQERITQRNEGGAQALERLRNDPDGEGVWLHQFVDALFQDFLLDNLEGACFVLRALPKRKTSAPNSAPVEQMLGQMARTVFTDLLKSKTEEALEQTLMYS